jgi:transketolase
VTSGTTAEVTELAFWRELAQQLRVDSIRASAAPKSGHPTSSMPAAELMAVLTSKYLRYDFDRPDHPGNDRLIFSKGHASPLLYSMYKACGAVSDEELLTFRSFGSRLEGHPRPVLPWVDVATGSLGQGLPIGIGLALATRLEQSPARVWVLCGDSEMAEGSMWEAFEHGSFYELDNLIAIIDVNRLGQRGQTMHGWDLSSYVRRAEAFGWAAIEIDGHDVAAVDRAYEEALSTRGRPTVIVARTIKGKGVKAVENKENWHGKPLADPEAAIAELGGQRNITVDVHEPPAFEPRPLEQVPPVLPRYDVGEQVATRKAYGDALVALGKADGAVVALDGEVSNSTIKLCGSHAGVSIGEDGPSQMALEDIAAFRAIDGSTVLYPSDANQTAKLVAAMADLEGISFLRTTRAATPVIYDADEAFPIGGSKVVRSSDEDDVTIIGAGITLHEALKAADALAEEGINARVIDLYSVKPIDAAALHAAAKATHGRMVTVEDHWPEGGVGEAVLSAFDDAAERQHVSIVAVRELPSSGKPMELLAAAGIDAEHIIQAVRELVADSRTPAAAR